VKRCVTGNVWHIHDFGLLFITQPVCFVCVFVRVRGINAHTVGVRYKEIHTNWRVFERKLESEGDTEYGDPMARCFSKKLLHSYECVMAHMCMSHGIHTNELEGDAEDGDPMAHSNKSWLTFE